MLTTNQKPAAKPCHILHSYPDSDHYRARNPQDFCSLYQHPRTPLFRHTIFKKALEGGVMGQVYASAVGTTVLQIKEIPLRPKEFDGVLCLFGPKAHADERMVRDTFGSRFGEIVDVIDRRLPPVERDEIAVRFPTHQAALDAIAAGVPQELCNGLDTLYNERPYDGRGWYAALVVRLRARSIATASPSCHHHKTFLLRAASSPPSCRLIVSAGAAPKTIQARSSQRGSLSIQR